MLKQIHTLLVCLSITLSPCLSQNLNVSLRSTLEFPGQKLANIWGYSAGGYEYALVGAKNGMIVVNITDPNNPVQIVQITGPSSDWREIKTYSHYAYVVSEGGGAVQVVNLNNLPNSNLSYQSVDGGSGMTKGHALHIDEVKGYLYVYGSNLNGGRTQVFNLNNDPYNPSYVGYVNFIGYAHDGYVNNDMLYSAHIYAGQFAIINMANKTNPTLLGTQTTPGAFTHNTWLSGNTLFTTDEVSNSYLATYNVSNPNNITMLDRIQITPGSGSIVHNTHVLDNYAVTSWYKDGFAIIDGNRPANLVKVGWYDTYPGGSGNGFEGCWGVYPYFPSGNIVASNIRNPNTNDGVLYVLTPTYVRGCYLEGQVTSAATGQPLPGAKVTIIGTSTQESANANGDYKMGQVENGVFTVQVSLPGYITHTGQVTLDNGVLTIHNVALSQQPLPVELVRFDVKAAGQNAILNWETATETGNAGFEIQQTIAGKQEWQPIAMVPPKGDGKSPARYDFRTETLQPGKYIFRLRQIDLDGGSTLLPARTVTIYGSSLQISLSPNPAGAETRIIIGTAQREKVALKLLDAQGRPTGFSSETEVDGALEIPLPLDDLPAGQYLLMGQTGRESVRKILIKN